MGNLRKVLALRDESGHWYVIPVELVDKFRELQEKAGNDDYEAEEEFIKLFSSYMTGGDLNNIQLYIYL